VALSVQPFVALERNEHDLKDRERFEWPQDDDTAYWPHEAGVYRRIESANTGRRVERHAGLERSQSSRPRCHSLPRNMSNRRHLPRQWFSLYIRLDRQRAVQRSIKFAESSTRHQAKGGFICLPRHCPTNTVRTLTLRHKVIYDALRFGNTGRGKSY
jgi:hypothetical protein